MSNQIRDKPHRSILSLPGTTRFPTRSPSMVFENQHPSHFGLGPSVVGAARLRRAGRTRTMSINR